jgi:hypothetical protein
MEFRDGTKSRTIERATRVKIFFVSGVETLFHVEEDSVVLDKEKITFIQVVPKEPKSSATTFFLANIAGFDFTNDQESW